MPLEPARFHLLEGLVDYAGLFPPAALSLEEAVNQYLAYAHGEQAWMLGRFVAPARRLSELASLLPEAARIKISALVEAPGDLDAIDEFHARVSSSVRVDCIEARLALAPQLHWNYYAYFEVTEPEFAAAARQCGPAPRVGLKLRTGSVEASGIPAASTVVAFLQAVRGAQLPFKFTAGLHHARPGEYALTYAADSPRARMYGFTSLFGLACLFWWGRLTEPELQAALENDTKLVIDASGILCNQARCSPAEVEQFRSEGGRSFGSCSFLEPVSELKEMQWI